MNETLSRMANGVGEDKSVTRAVIYTIGVSLIITAVTGGVFIGTMRANSGQIVQNRVEFFQRLDQLREEQINQDEQLDRVQTSLIELNATVGTIHGDVQSITNGSRKSAGDASSADGSTSTSGGSCRCGCRRPRRALGLRAWRGRHDRAHEIP